MVNMTKNDRSVDKITLAKMTIYVMSVDKMTGYETSVDKMNLDDTLVGIMSVDIMTRDEMTCCQILFTETFFSQCLKMRSLTKKQTFPTYLTKKITSLYHSNLPLFCFCFLDRKKIVLEFSGSASAVEAWGAF